MKNRMPFAAPLFAVGCENKAPVAETPLETRPPAKPTRNVTTSVGALQALQAQKRGGVKMVAFDPDPVLIDALRAGQLDAIILQNPYQMGYEGVKALAQHFQGEKVPRIVDTGIELATRESLSNPEIKRLLGPP